MREWLRRLLCRLGLCREPELHYIGGSDTLPPPLSRERETELLNRLGEEAADQELIEHNLRLVVYIARRFENTGINIEDLISIGTIVSSRPWAPIGRIRTSSWQPTHPGASKTKY